MACPCEYCVRRQTREPQRVINWFVLGVSLTVAVLSLAGFIACWLVRP